MDRAGYRALGAGKTFHNNAQPKDYDHARSWTEPYIPYDKHGELGNFFPLCLARDHTYYRCPIAARDEKELVDRKTVDAFVPQLRALAANASAPFFAMVGLYKPHMPWMCPSASFDAVGDGDEFEPQEHAAGSPFLYKSALIGVSPIVTALWRTRHGGSASCSGAAGPTTTAPPPMRVRSAAAAASRRTTAAERTLPAGSASHSLTDDVTTTAPSTNFARSAACSLFLVFLSKAAKQMEMAPLLMS